MGEKLRMKGTKEPLGTICNERVREFERSVAGDASGLLLRQAGGIALLLIGVALAGNLAGLALLFCVPAIFLGITVAAADRFL